MRLRVRLRVRLLVRLRAPETLLGLARLPRLANAVDDQPVRPAAIVAASAIISCRLFIILLPFDLHQDRIRSSLIPPGGRI